MIKKNLIGQKYNKLTVISAAENIKTKKGSNRSFSAWNCKCDCGKNIIVRTNTLTNNQQQSCGCIIYSSGIAIKSGAVFNKLKAISYNKGYWLCECECGNTTTVLTSHLISGNTKSCGCLKTNKKSDEFKILISEKSRKYEPKIASARRMWKSYLYNDENCTLTFDKYYELSQMNCNYCGIEPINITNCFTLKKGASIKAKNEGNFICNGIDRINSSLPHSDNNCITSCLICNMAKNNRSSDDFYKYISNLEVKNIDDLNVIKLKLPNNNYELTTLKTVFRRYNEGDLSIEDFYSLSQMQCFYCNIEKSNISNYAKIDWKSSQKAIDNANFIYNGIDRIDSNLPHNKNNVVPCCKYCNFAKSNLTFEEFQNWIKRVKSFQNK